MRKLLSLSLALLLCAVSLCAIAQGDPYGPEFAGYPIQTDETLTMWISGGLEMNAEYGDFNDWPFFHYLEEASGVSVAYSAPVAGADANQAYNLLLASGDLPDIVYTGGLPAKSGSLMEDGYAVALDEYLPAYAPALYARLTNDEMTNQSLKTDQGNYYAFPFLREDVAYLGTFIGMAVHTKLLEEAGLEKPVTLEDWDTMLYAFRDLCDIPLGGNSLTRLKGLFSNAFGFNGMNTYYLDEGKVKTWINAEGYPEQMRMLSRWMADGLIDPDIITIDSKTFYQKVVAQVYGACYQGSGAVQGYIQPVTERDGGFFYEAVPYPVRFEGDPIRHIQGEAAWEGSGAFITTACASIPLACRWLDFSYTPEGITTWNYGKEGETYTIVDGKAQYTPLITEANEPMREAASRYCGINGNGFSVMQVHFDQIRNPPIATEFVSVWTKDTEDAVNYRMPTLTATDAEAIELSDLESALITYANEMFVGFLIGSESLDAYEQYLANLEALRIDRVLEIKQAQYDRFDAR